MAYRSDGTFIPGVANWEMHMYRVDPGDEYTMSFSEDYDQDGAFALADDGYDDGYDDGEEMDDGEGEDLHRVMTVRSHRHDGLADHGHANDADHSNVPDFEDDGDAFATSGEPGERAPRVNMDTRGGTPVQDSAYNRSGQNAAADLAPGMNVADGDTGDIVALARQIAFAQYNKPLEALSPADSQTVLNQASKARGYQGATNPRSEARTSLPPEATFRADTASLWTNPQIGYARMMERADDRLALAEALRFQEEDRADLEAEVVDRAAKRMARKLLGKQLSECDGRELQQVFTAVGESMHVRRPA
jgi:hypothetical protein